MAGKKIDKTTILRNALCEGNGLVLPLKERQKAAMNRGAAKTAAGLSNYAVFFDFDNTVTDFDVLDDIIERFSINGYWKKLESDWLAGKISSKECLKEQLEAVRITKKNLLEYLAKIKVDPAFKKLIVMLKHEGASLFIVSDDFSFIIKTILRNNGIRGIEVYANSIRFSKDRLIPLFPHMNRLCFKSANCKMTHILHNGYGKKIIVYIGDGLSDVCPATHADLVFAKGNLRKYLRVLNKRYIKFRKLEDIYSYFKEVKHERQA